MSVGAKIWIKFVWLVIIQSLWCLIEVTDSSVEIYRVFTFFFGDRYSESLIYSFYVQFDLLSNVINHLFGINMNFVSIVGRLQIHFLPVLVIHIFFSRHETHVPCSYEITISMILLFFFSGDDSPVVNKTKRCLSWRVSFLGYMWERIQWYTLGSNGWHTKFIRWITDDWSGHVQK